MPRRQRVDVRIGTSGNSTYAARDLLCAPLQLGKARRKIGRTALKLHGTGINPLGTGIKVAHAFDQRGDLRVELTRTRRERSGATGQRAGHRYWPWQARPRAS